MKKRRYVLLTAALLLGLAACGGETGGQGAESREALLEQASLLDLSEVAEEAAANPVRAEEQVQGQVCMVQVGTGQILSETQVEFYQESTGAAVLRATLPEEDVLSLDQGELCYLVGKVTGLSNGTLSMEPAYLISEEEARDIWRNGEEAALLPEMAASFGKDGTVSGLVDSGPSHQYFEENHDYFRQLTGEEIRSGLPGTWTVSDSFGDTAVYTFQEDGTGTMDRDGETQPCAWLEEDGSFYYGRGPIDTEQNVRMEVRELEEGLWILYQNDVGTSSGYTYEMNGPYAVMERQEAA